MYKRVIALLSLGIGVFVLMQVLMPFITYKIWELTFYQENIALISPRVEKADVLGISIKNNSFPSFLSTSQRSAPAPYKNFNISIPSIKLHNIGVMVDSNYFDQNLAHLPGTALPGEKGNVFITGHSALPQLYSPNNFKTIFSNLPKIKKGDKIIIEASGQEFEYVVKGLKIVSPEETWVIEPPDTNGRYLSLMTCVPPGLYLKRLLVFSELRQ